MPLSPPALHSPPNRKATGVYYTPKLLIDLLLNHALPNCISPNAHPLKILDPACGPGDFLLAAHARLPTTPHHLFGIDIDPAALTNCRAALTASIHPSSFTLHPSNALLNPPDFLAPQSFDLILGNPPYVNAIEGNLTPATKSRLRALHPNVKGAADLAHYFLDQAIRLVKPGGRIALVLPRAILNSPAAAHLRANLPPHLRPNLIYAPDRHDFFPGAAVFICLLILGPDPTCIASTDPDPATATFHRISITSSNWWFPLATAFSGRACPPCPSLDAERPHHQTLSSQFQLAASMIAADAYNLIPHLTDDANAPGLKLVTTGLIEPRQCLWGQRPCRYLKKDYRHPRLIPSDNLTRSLASRVTNARRPKILLAGLAKKIEAFLDPTGDYIGAVSTYSIYHPTDDTAALTRLLNHLLNPAATQHFISHLGANALRGRHITLKKSYLLNLQLPPAPLHTD
ncbi:MAG: type modification enzyme [Phycisphaerales bacterium]|nr:type modification enzyme [Phycisphaerales bacterium]